jgi:hypothetical protein
VTGYSKQGREGKGTDCLVTHSVTEGGGSHSDTHGEGIRNKEKIVSKEREQGEERRRNHAFP